jgi:type IV pilus assembly protein PilA
MTPGSHAPARLRERRGEAGFTLTELLIVIGVILIITVIVIPNVTGMRVETNENAAIASLRGIYDAEIQYHTNYPTHGFACSLTVLGGKPGSAAPSPLAAQLLPNDIVSGKKGGYTFTVAECPQSNGIATGFEVIAVPQVLGKTGHRGFCIDQQGETKADPEGATNCSQSVE